MHEISVIEDQLAGLPSKENEAPPSQFLTAVTETLPEEHGKVFKKLLQGGLFAGSPLGSGWNSEKIWNFLHTGSGTEWGIATFVVLCLATNFVIKDWRHATKIGLNMNTIFSASVAVLVGSIRWAGFHPTEAQKIGTQAIEITQRITMLANHLLNLLQ